MTRRKSLGQVAYAAGEGRERQVSHDGKIDPRIADAFTRMIMGNADGHTLVDSLSKGRIILSHIYGQYGYHYPDAEEARKELIELIREA